MYEQRDTDGNWSVITTPDRFVEVSVPKIGMTTEEALELSSALIEAARTLGRAQAA